MTSLPDSDERRYGRVFDEIAAEYDRYRPAYPDQLIDQACRVAGIGNGDPVLEIGCGSGQLTRSLAGRGLRVTALEPGPRLLSLARQNLADSAEVEFVNARFEDARLDRGRFLAVFTPRTSSAPWSARCRFTPGSHRASAKPWTGSTRRSAGDSGARYAPARSRSSSPPAAARVKLAGRPHRAAQLTGEGGAMSAHHQAPPETGR